MRVVTVYPLLERKHFIFFSFLLFLHFFSCCFSRLFCTFLLLHLSLTFFYSNCNCCALLLSSFLFFSLLSSFFLISFILLLIYFYLVYYFLLFFKFSFFLYIGLTLASQFWTVLYLRAGNYSVQFSHLFCTFLLLHLSLTSLFQL